MGQPVGGVALQRVYRHCPVGDGGAVIPLAARRRVMFASSLIDTASCREAAILGGIVRNAIEHGWGIDGDNVGHYAAHIIRDFNLVGVDRTPPGPTEVGMMMERFEAAFGHKFT